jgi:hypothetical protein
VPDESVMAPAGRDVHSGRMKKRVAAALLWFYAAWYAGAMIAHVLDISGLIGPILGAAAAALFVGDPRHVIWTRATPPSRPAQSAGNLNVQRV